MRCVSYTRTVSCLREKEIPSDIINQQNKRIQEFIKQKGWSLVKKYSDRKKDEFEDGAFLEMRQDAIGRQFDCLVVDSMFRCGRNTNVAAEIFRNVFLPAGIGFAVAEDNFCSCEVSKEEAFRYLEEKVKEYRSYTVNEDMRKYVETKKFPKYGYQYKEDSMELEIDPTAASHVKKIFQLVSEGHSFKETAEIMTDAGIMSSGKYVDMLWGRTVIDPDAPWKKDQIKRIIYNRQYIGEWTRTINGEKQLFHCPAIIDKAVFDKVNQRNEAKGDKSNLGKTPMNPFSKLIFDKETGIPLKLYRHERLKIRVFRRSYESKETIKYEKGNMPYDEVHDAVYQLLIHENELAGEIMIRMGTSEWQMEKEKQLQSVRAMAQIVFRRMTELEEENLFLFQKFRDGNISEEAYEKGKDKNLSEFELKDQLLQQYIKQMEEVEKCFSPENPWIKLFCEIDIPEELKREHVKKWIERIETVQFKTVEIRFKHWEWKERFPKQWLEEESYGTKK